MFKVDTIRKKAVVFFPDGTREVGQFFVSPVSANHDSSESISELLMSERRYVPFRTEGKDVILLQKDNILKVLIKDVEDEYLAETAQKIIVRICFLSGEEMSGTVKYSMPKTHSRLSDFLNQNGEFFAFETDEGIFLINHRYVRSIEGEHL